MQSRNLSFLAPLFVLLYSISSEPAQAQVPGPNVNMVSGTKWPGGDPFLQRQNEPSIAVSTRNPLHLLGGANDYRTVDLPSVPELGLADADAATVADAWLGLFKSRDGGLTWRSTLLPGYPQDNSPEGMASPLKGLSAGADATVRFGTNGLAYYSGIAFERKKNGKGAVFVARFIDDNNNEKTDADTIRYLGTSVVAGGNAGQFLDRGSLAVGLPLGGATCTIPGANGAPPQTVPAGNVYLAYTDFVGQSANNVHTKIKVSTSQNCGASWNSVVLSEGDVTYQGTAIAIDPRNGDVYVAWRRYALKKQTDSILVSRSVNQGQTFSPPVEIIPSFFPYQPGTSPVAFRTSAVPTMAIDNSGRVYVAWSARVSPTPTATGPSDTADARIVISTSSNGGVTWTTPTVADPIAPGGTSQGRGHQMMPTLTFAGGKLMLLYYDQREDHTVGQFNFFGGLFSEVARATAGDLFVNKLAKVFTEIIMDASPISGDPMLRRHTLDVRVAQATPADIPAFTYATVSQFAFGMRKGCGPGGCPIQQLQFNPPNLPMFKQGTVPFMGDYIDIAALSFVQKAPGGPWSPNSEDLPAPVFHAAWTDNRNVRKPAGGDWTKYTPVTILGSNTSVLDPSQQRPACEAANTGSRNQDIYTSRITQGLYVGALGNSKPLLPNIQRAFTVFVKNETDLKKAFRLTLSLDVPPGDTKASFLQLSPSRQSVDATIARKSSISRTVFVTSSNAKARVYVRVEEIDAPGGNLIQTGLTSAVVLNPDDSAPTLIDPGTVPNTNISTTEIYSPDISSPDISSPDISSPDISSPDISSPDISSPDISSPDISSPDISSPDISSPDISSPDISSPDISSPDISSPDISSGSLQDATWNVTNKGNTSATYSFKVAANNIPANMKFQLIARRVYRTPTAQGCTLKQLINSVAVASITEADQIFSTLADLVNTSANLTNPALKNLTFSLDPGQTATVTLRAVGKTGSGVTAQAVSTFLTTGVTAATAPLAINTTAIAAGVTQPPVTFSGTTTLTVTTTSLPNATQGVPYSASMTATGGTAPLTWFYFGTLPIGLTFNANGTFSGTPTQAGTFSGYFVVQDSSTPKQSALGVLSTGLVVIAQPVSFVTQPTNSTTDFNITPSPSVRVLDASGAAIAGVPVTISLAANPSGGTLSGTPSQNTDATGLATFPGLFINRGGWRYALNATAGAGSTISREFNIVGFAPSGSMVPDPLFLGQGAVRHSHTATLLPTGKVLMFGGFGPGGTAIQGAELFDPATNSYSPTGTGSGGAVANHTAVLLSKGVVLLSGGQDSLGGIQKAQQYYFIGGAGGVGIAPVMTIERQYHTATLLPNGKVLIAGGQGVGGGILASAEIFDKNVGSISIAPMTVPRAHHTATLLPNGKVLIAGGVAVTDGTTLQSFEIFDPSSNTFTAVGLMSTFRSLHAATLLPNGKVLISGGRNHLFGESVLNSAEIYDPGSNTFTTTGSMLAQHLGHTSTVLPNGKVLISGGAADGTAATPATAAAELFDPAAGTFAFTGVMGQMRGFHTATMLPNGKVLVAGGNDGTNTLGTSELFYPTDPLFTLTGFAPTGNLVNKRYNHTATKLPNGKILIAGGFDIAPGPAILTLASAELYDPGTGLFSATGSMNVGRAIHTATLLPNGKVLIAGGFNNSPPQTLASTELYDISTGLFTLAGNMSAPRQSHSATLLGNGRVLLAFGENSSSTALNHADLFDSASGAFVGPPVFTVLARTGQVASRLPGGGVLLTGGKNSAGIVIASTVVYDPESGAFGSFAFSVNMNTARLSHGQEVLPNGNVLVLGGVNGPNPPIATAEIFDISSGTFSSTGNLSRGRGSPITAVLFDGKILVAGGSGPETYDPGTGVFSLTAPDFVAAGSLTLTTLPNGKVLFAGGQLFGGAVNPGTQLFSPGK